MAQQADGTVYINTKIDTSGVETDTRKIQSALKRTADTVSRIGNSIKNAFSFGKISGGENAEKQVETIGEKVERLKESLKYLHDIKGLGFGDEQYDSVYQALVSANEELKQYRSNLAQSALAEQNAGQSVGFIQSALNGLKMAAHAPVSILQKLGQAIKSLPHKMLDLAASGLRKVGDAAKSAASSAGKTLLGGVKNLVSSFLGLNRSVKQSNSGFGSSLKSMLKYGLGIRSVFVLVNKLRSALVEGFKNLAQYDSRTNASISSLMSALTQLKNSFATAFAPVLNVVAPILTSFINLISAAVSKVGMLIAALTGQDTFTKAVAVQENYAASLGDTADKAEKAQKAVEGYLSPIDEINKMEKPDQSGSAGGSGSGGYAAPTPGEMFETVPIENNLKNLADKIRGFFQSEDWQGLGGFIADGLNRGMEKVKQTISWDNVGPSVTHFVDAFTTTLNSLVDNFNWELLGQTVGTGVNTIVNTINLLADNIDWKGIGDGIARGFNGLFDTVNAEELGKALSQKIKIAVQMAYGFVTTFDWSQFGKWIGDGINGFVNNIDFGLLARTLSVGIIGALNSLSTAIEQVDWYGLGKKVQEFLVNIDWAGIFSALFEVIGAALGGLALFIWGIIEDAWKSVIKWWHDNAFEDGEFTIKGLLDGISEALKNIGTWIKENIFDPFIKGFKKTFGIASPSTVMFQMGTFIMQGLLNGISSLVSNVNSIFTMLGTGIKQIFSNIKQSALTIWQNIKTSIVNVANTISSTAQNIFKNMVNGISNIFKNLIGLARSPLNTVIGFLNSLISAAQNAWNTIADFLSFDIQIPKALQALTGWSHVSLGLPRIRGSYRIPYLATGAVIPPNAPFMAVLGDQKHGTNVEAPVATIEAAVDKAVRNAMQGQTGGTIHVHVDLNGRQIAETVLSELELKRIRSGRPVLGGA